jgi:hypothetical protein
MMQKLYIQLLCILIAVLYPVRGIVVKVQDAKSELQPSPETQLAGIQGSF